MSLKNLGPLPHRFSTSLCQLNVPFSAGWRMGPRTFILSSYSLQLPLARCQLANLSALLQEGELLLAITSVHREVHFCNCSSFIIHSVWWSCAWRQASTGRHIEVTALHPGDWVRHVDAEPKGLPRVIVQVPLLLIIFLSFVAQETYLNNTRRRKLI